VRVLRKAAPRRARVPAGENSQVRIRARLQTRRNRAKIAPALAAVPGRSRTGAMGAHEFTACGNSSAPRRDRFPPCCHSDARAQRDRRNLLLIAGCNPRAGNLPRERTRLRSCGKVLARSKPGRARVHSCREDLKIRRALAPEVCFSNDASIISQRVRSRKEGGRSAIRNRILPSNIPSGSAPDSPRHRALPPGVRRSAGTRGPTCVAKDSKPAGTACVVRR
jgi:hypothetical protein